MNAEPYDLARLYLKMIDKSFDLHKLCVVIRKEAPEGRYFNDKRKLKCTMGIIINENMKNEVMGWQCSCDRNGLDVHALFKKFGPNIIQEMWRPLIFTRKGRELLGMVQTIHDNPKKWTDMGMNRVDYQHLMNWVEKEMGRP